MSLDSIEAEPKLYSLLNYKCIYTVFVLLYVIHITNNNIKILYIVNNNATYYKYKVIYNIYFMKYKDKKIYLKSYNKNVERNNR